MGYLSEFICLIERLSDRAEKHRDYLANNEAATRACLVDPVLRLLGWDVSDPEQVSVEYKVEGKSADYALMRDSKPLILIEAKSLGAKLKDDLWQLAVYAAKTGAVLGVITDGDEWVFLNSSDTSRPKKARVRLLSQDARSAAVELLTQLDAADATVRPQPGPPVDFNPAETNGDKGDTSRRGQTAPRGLQVPLTDLLSRLQAAGGKNKDLPLKAIITPDGGRFPIRNTTDLLRVVAKKVAASLPLPLPDAAGKTRYIVAEEPVHRNGRPFKDVCAINGLYLETNYSAENCIRNAIHLIRKAQTKPELFTVELQATR